MVRSCCVKFCKHEWQPNTSLSFFRFPVKNGMVANKWREVVPCKGTLRKSSYVCSDHFIESDFTYTRRLKKTAVPSIFPVELHLVKVAQHEAQAAILHIYQEKACPLAYERHHNSAPGGPLFSSTTDAAPGPSQFRQYYANQFQSDMQVQEDSAGADTAVVSVDPTEGNFSKKSDIRNKSKMAETLQKERGKVSALTRKIRIIQNRLRRQQAKFRNVKTILKLLKRKTIEYKLNEIYTENEI